MGNFIWRYKELKVMFLSKEQEKMLDGDHGTVIAKCMELVVKIGEVYGAECLVPVESTQIAGVSYLTVGDPIFSFFKMLMKDNVQVKVPSWLNPAGMDLKRWKEMGISTDFANKQLQILDNYKKLGIKPTLTCTPYLIGYQPRYESHLAWSESSAVIMANGYYGARTNREGGPSSLASALTGFTAKYGMHLRENRRPQLKIKVKINMKDFVDFSILGYWFGEKYKDKIPIFEGIKKLDLEYAKLLSSAMAASGSVPLFHVLDITPEAKNEQFEKDIETIEFTLNEKKEVQQEFTSDKQKIDLVVLGCPHASKRELKMIVNSLEKKEIKNDIDLWIFTSKKILDEIREKSIISKIERSGGEVFVDTCMVVCPVIKEKHSIIATNSAKAAFYLSKGENNTKVLLLSLSEIFAVITKCG